MQNIHYDPSKRLYPIDTFNKFKEIFYIKDDFNDLLLLLNTLHLDKETINKKLNEDVDQINTIIERAIKKKNQNLDK